MGSVKKCFVKVTICLYFFVAHVRNASGFIRVPRQANNINGCVLPEHPRHGNWSVYNSTSQLSPGMIVPLTTILQIECQKYHVLDSDTTIVCIDGNWTDEIGQCLITCPPIYSTSVMKVTCAYNSKKSENCIKAVSGTIAKFKCADFYEDKGLERQPFNFCQNGRWSHIIPECRPVCGQKLNKDNSTLIVSGSVVAKGEYPWQAAIYNISNKLLICGGSIINEKVILTAAHCITDEKGQIYPTESYIVAVGKYYRAYDDPRDDTAQFSPVYQIFIPKHYKGDIQNYYGNIAILVTKKTFFLSSRVQPVCVDWAARYQKTLLDPTKLQYAYVSGWGSVQHKEPSDVLKELRVPVVTEAKCVRDLPKNDKKYLTSDKLCAAYLESGTSVCKEDSGGGLFFQYENKFYVAGVLSKLSPQATAQEGGCDTQQYALFTNVYDYIETLILENEARFRPEYDFRCNSGEYIPEYNKCDGKAECDDYSDEMNATCWKIPCPEFSYRCKYGGCVNGTAECNSIVECFDGSDEDPNICGTKTPVPVTPATPAPVTPGTRPAGSCVLPEHPEFGEWSVQLSTERLVPGNFVPSGKVLKVKCKTQHKLEGKDIILCENGEWTAPLGKCSKLCPPRFSTNILTVTCISSGKETVNCTDAVDGTLAHFKCTAYYEDLTLKQNPFHICKNGKWNKEVPTCAPVCGRKTVDAQKLIVNGSPVNKGDYPWQVALYTVHDMNLRCGGSLLNQRVILTAAHCITDEKGNLLSKELYIVAVGKYFRQHNDSRDYKEAQFSELQYMFKPVQYEGSTQNYLGDIAILVTKKTFVLSRRVQPVCVDFGQNYINPDANEFGYVTGWGYTVENAKPSDVLKELKVPAISYSKCRNSLPEDYEIYLTYDKLCAGYLDNGTSVCSGDSGGGLVFKHDGRYYITGIVSLSPNSPTLSVGGCDTQQYGLYTKVAAYISDFILKKEYEYRP